MHSTVHLCHHHTTRTVYVCKTWLSGDSVNIIDKNSSTTEVAFIGIKLETHCTC